MPQLSDGLEKTLTEFSEIDKINIKVNFITDFNNTKLQWVENTLFLPNANTLLVYDTFNSMNSSSTSIPLSLQAIEVDEKSPTAHVISNSAIENLESYKDRARLAIDINLCPNRSSCIKVNSVIESVHFANYEEKLFLILTDFGSLFVYRKVKRKWLQVANLTKFILDHRLEVKVDNVFQTLKDIEDLTSSVNVLTCCWIPKSKNEFIVLTSHLNADLCMWILETLKDNVAINYGGSFVSGIGIVNKIEVVNNNGNILLMLCGKNGQISLLKDYDSENRKEIYLWEFDDAVSISNIAHVIKDEKVIYLATKNNFLLAFTMESWDENIISVAESINDQTIRDLKVYDNSIYALVGSKIYQVEIFANKSELSFNYVELQTSLQESLQTTTFALSQNKTVWASFDTGFSGHNKSNKVIFHRWHKVDNFKILLSNSDQPINKMFDCINLIREDYLKQKHPMPFETIFSKVDINNPCSYFLKVSLLLVKIIGSYKYLELGLVPYVKQFLSTHTENRLKDLILFNQAVRNIETLLEKKKDMVKLLKREEEILTSSFKFINFFVKDYDYDINQYISKSDLECLQKICDLDSMNRCEICDGIFSGFFCDLCHVQQVCVLSFRVIPNPDTLYCHMCTGTAHQDLLDTSTLVICPFCDIPMFSF